MAREPAFEVRETGDVTPGETLLVGTAGLGVAGLTATDYLVTHVETTQVGHVRTRNLPDITPFSDGQPRRPARLYSTAESDVTILITELFLPVTVSDLWAEAVLEWAAERGVTEVTALHGAPFPHQPHEHAVYHVATDGYRERHFDGEGGADIEPLAGGFFDGIIGELLSRSLEEEGPPTGVLVTPTHLPGPDFDAAIRLLDALETVHGVETDESELRGRADEMEQYYEELAGRMQTLREEQAADDYPNDRMYM
jgi:uncharacterized protein